MNATHEANFSSTPTTTTISINVNSPFKTKSFDFSDSTSIKDCVKEDMEWLQDTPISAIRTTTSAPTDIPVSLSLNLSKPIESEFVEWAATGLKKEELASIAKMVDSQPTSDTLDLIVDMVESDLSSSSSSLHSLQNDHHTAMERRDSKIDIIEEMGTEKVSKMNVSPTSIPVTCVPPGLHKVYLEAPNYRNFLHRPSSSAQSSFNPSLLDLLTQIEPIFNSCIQDEISFSPITSMCKLPRYINRSFYIQASQLCHASWVEFSNWWKGIDFRSEDSIIFSIMKQPASPYLIMNDVKVVIQDVVLHHPGLNYLNSMEAFQARYVETVIARLFYGKKNCWDGKFTFAQFRTSQFVSLLRQIELQDEMNAIRHVFSYKHFYVIYCKFWELDQDHDLQIDMATLKAFDYNALTESIIEQVMAKNVHHTKPIPIMTYTEFISFLLSVEDKSTPSAIEYWFRCLDIDGDGKISFFELKHFWQEQYNRMLEYGMADPWKFDDFVCSIIDLLHPQHPNYFTLADFKKCPSAAQIFDLIFDIRKYDAHVRKIDPIFREMDIVSIIENGKFVRLQGWDKFAERAYIELSAEDQQQQQSVVQQPESAHSFSPCHSDEEEEDEVEGDMEGTNDKMPGIGDIIHVVLEQEALSSPLVAGASDATLG